jgi:hypothetical protein
MAREPKADVTGTTSSAVSAPTINDAAPKPQTKASLVEKTLAREEGASLDDLCQATGWLAHTCRAFLTGLRKKGKNIVRTKCDDGAAIYKLEAKASSGDTETAAPTEAAA